MSDDPREWTDADQQTIGDALYDYLTGLGLPPEMVRPYGAAAAVLDALAAAGRLAARRELERLRGELETKSVVHQCCEDVEALRKRVVELEQQLEQRRTGPWC